MNCTISDVSHDTVIKFLAHYKYEPEDNKSFKCFDDGNYDAIDKLGGKTLVKFKTLTSHAMSTNRIYDVAFISVLLAYKPSVGRGTNSKFEHPERKYEFKKGFTHIIADFLVEAITCNFYSFDDCWNRILKCYKDVQNYLIANDEHSYTAGKIQKLVNMSIKYFYVLFKLRADAGKDNRLNADLFKYATFPVDNKLIEYLKKPEIGICFDSPAYNGSNAWVTANDFTVFGKFEKAVYEKVSAMGYSNLIVWEFYAYNEANGING